MGQYKQRQKNRYFIDVKEPFRISRGKIDLFLECPRCFWLDRKMGLGRPSMPGFSLNSAVDQLLKNEFDILRKEKKKHQLMHRFGIEAIPFDHPDLPTWRDDNHRFTGAVVLHQPTNLEISGIIDDLWINDNGQLHIVDYKSTSTNNEISLEDEYKQSYKKQMEVYQWIFRRLGFAVSDIGYFVYANAVKNRPKFDARLEFKVNIIEYKGDDSWVEPTLFEIKKCLDSDEIPSQSAGCEYCHYRKLVGGIENVKSF